VIEAPDDDAPRVVHACEWAIPDAKFIA